jgi:protein involved in polysaccharide export with SLBB domain
MVRKTPAILICAAVLSAALLAQSPAPTVSIKGAVTKPGAYAFKTGLTIRQLLAMSGGFQTNADRLNIQILRSRQAETETIRVDFYEVVQRKGNDLKLEAGDTIVVPEGDGKSRPGPIRIDFTTPTRG